MLHLVRALIDTLNSSGIKYCSWKSNIRLDDALLGKTDIDLLVNQKDIFPFLRIVSMLEFREQISPLWATFPAISHYIGFDEDAAQFVHLHVHYRLLMGKSLRKSYYIPIEGLLLTHIRHIHNVPVPIPAVETLVHLIRMALKKTFGAELKRFARRLWGRQPSDPMRHELGYLTTQTNGDELAEMLEKIGTMVPSKCSRVLQYAASQPEKVSPSVLRALRKTLRGFRRYGLVTEILGFFCKKCAAIFARITGSAGKRLASGGAMFAVVGADGAGKTTVVHELIMRLGRENRVRSYYLGSSRYTFRTRMVWLFCAPAVVLNKLLPSCRTVLFMRSLSAGLLEYSFARDRLHRYRRGWRHAANGTIVIFERFPVANVIDHPSVNAWETAYPRHPVISWLGKRIAKIYERFENPKLFVFLHIDPVVAVERKLSDHRLEMVAPKQDRLSRFAKEKKRAVLEIDATLPLETVVAQTMNGIWTSL
jgi:thymidylate kinase